MKHIRFKKGLTQLQLSLKVFDKPNLEYIGRLERGTLAGITFTSAEKLCWHWIVNWSLGSLNCLSLII